MNNIGALVEGETIFITKFIPREYEIVEKLVPVEFTDVPGGYIPKEFLPVLKYLPIGFEEIEVPVLVPKL